MQNEEHIDKKLKLQKDDDGTATPAPVPPTNDRAIQVKEPLLLIQSTELTLDNDPIGSGGASCIFKAQYHTDKGNVDVALKLYKKDMSQSIFDNEKNVHHPLTHPNIVKFYGVVNESAGLRGYVLELATEGTLDDYLQNNTNSNRSASLCLTYLTQLCSALCYLKNERIIHRDIKPTNLLRFSNGTLKVCDFSLSVKLNEGENERIEQYEYGSYDFGAPEMHTKQSDGKYHITPAFDVYSAALIALLLTTDAYFYFYPDPTTDAESVKWIQDHKDLHRIENKDLRINPNTSPDVVSFIRNGLEVNPVKRPSPAEMLAVLQKEGVKLR